MKQFLTSIFVLSLLTNFAAADNWGHWRGENGNSVSTTATPPIKWSPTENIKWKTPLPGRSSGSPIVWEDKVFVVTAVGDERGGNDALPSMEFKLICVDRASGKILWSPTSVVAAPHEGTHDTNSFASASPCTDGDHVYAHFGSRGLYCYTMDGALKWKRDNLGKMETRNTFGEGSSPTIVDNKIIVPWDHEGQSWIAALDKSTGEQIWKTDRNEPTCWATPLIVDNGDRKLCIMNGQTSARAYDVETGKELWRCGGQTQRPVASAVSNGKLAFVASGHRGWFLGAFHLDGNGDIQGTDKVAWSLDRNTPDIASPVLSGNRIYFHKGKNGIISCLNATTGEPHYMSKRLDDLRMIYASPVAAGGHVYFTGRNGATAVVKDADEFEVVATNSVGEGVDATPAPVDNELFIRGEKHLFCISEG